MKITRKRLMEIIKQEIKEFTTTAGGTTATKQRKTAASDTKSKKADKRTKKSAWDTAKKTYTTKSSAYDTKVSTYSTKNAALDAMSQQRYRKFNRAVKGGYDYSKNPIKGGEVNPTWTSKNNEKTAALNAKNTAETEKTSAESDRDTKRDQYQTAVDNLTASEKAEMATKAKTSFAVSAGGGGRGAGKGGTAKKAKKESLHRILGRDLINEIDDIKLSLKHQKKLHKK